MKFLHIVFLLLIHLILLLNTAAASSMQPVKIDILPVEYQEKKAVFAVKLVVPPQWKVYANTQGDTGLPLKIELLNATNTESYNILWPAFNIIVENFNGDTLKTFVYEDEVMIPISIVPQNANKPITATFKVLLGACNKICIKQEEILTSEINAGYLDNVTYTAVQKIVSPLERSSLSASPIIMILFAILGGFLLNFMPCVLPVLSLKLLSLLKHYTKDYAILRLNLLATTIGIFVSFILLALITISLKSTGELIGWGFHFQHPIFLMFMILILIIFASNLWGDFEIGLPMWLNDKLNSKSYHHGIYGSFFTGAIATLLATPCTVPFLTTSVAFALTQEKITTLYIYLAIALGMSLPYLMMCISKKSIRFLPKPGAWLAKFKKFSAILFLLTAAWLFYILFHQLSFRAVLVFIGGIVLFKFSVIYFAKSKYINVIAVIVGLLVIFSLPVVLNNKVKQEDFEQEILWERFNEAKLQEYINAGQVVFLDITAEWCLVCKANKLLFLDRNDILSFFSNNNVVLMKGDFTNHDAVISKFLENNQRFGIPFYAVYGPNAKKGIILSELLSGDVIKDAINKAKIG